MALSWAVLVSSVQGDRLYTEAWRSLSLLPDLDHFLTSIDRRAVN